jgi:hypothetical protein
MNGAMNPTRLKMRFKAWKKALGLSPQQKMEFGSCPDKMGVIYRVGKGKK